MGRSGNGSGSSDAWSMSLWFKMGTHYGGSKQTIFFFGDSDYDNGGHIWLYYEGDDKRLQFQYGSKNNNLQMTTANDSLSASTWHHILVSYDGGTTGSSSGSVAAYFSRFSIHIDGTLQSTTDDEDNYGWSSGIDSDVMYIGRRATSDNYMKNSAKVDEFSVWGSDESGNVSDIYNAGSTHDLSLLASSPDHWWRMGDGDTFPTLGDSVGSSDFTMVNMTVSEITTDVP